MIQIMKLGLRKFTVSIALFCYLAATMLASAHAVPISKPGDSDSAMVDSVVNIDHISSHCQLPDTPPSGQSDSATCKIFCAVMAQAVSQAVESLFVDVNPLNARAFFQTTVFSRQLSVEPYPPKLSNQQIRYLFVT
jgi:hypothetical protein